MRAIWPAVLVLALGACAPKEPVSKGKALFISLGCRNCHRVGAEGGKGGTDLTMVGFTRSREWLDLWLKNPQAWKKDTLMPNTRMSPEARAAIVEYLSTLKGQDWGASRPWKDAPDKGRVIFSRAGCVGCHGRGGTGGYPNNNASGGEIPALLHAKESFTKEELMKKIRGGAIPAKADPGGPQPLLSMPGWRAVLSEEEISAVADYVLSLGAGAPPSDW